MRKFDKPGTALRFFPRTALIAVAVTAGLLSPVAAISGLVQEKDAPGEGAAAKTQPGYLLRCWQDGKLIVEEYLYELPPTVDLTAAKLKALDTDRNAVYVTETRNATCLLRARAPERKRGLGW